MGKRKPFEPQSNDWLYRCPAEVSDEQIVATLHATDQPLTKFSARSWTEIWRMGNDLLRVYGYPENYFYTPGQQISGDSLNDWVFGFIGERWGYKTSKGEIFIIRDSRSEVSESLVLLIHIIDHKIRYWFKKHLSSSANIKVVLVGWTEDTLMGRIAGHRVGWQVNPWPGLSQHSSEKLD